MEHSFAATTRTVATYNESGFIATTFIPFPQAAPVCGPTKENTMYHDFDNDATEYSSAREHLAERLSDARSDHLDKGKIKYYLDENTPKTFKEFLDRVQNNKFTHKLKEEERDSVEHFSSYHSPYHYFEWRDPAHKPDHKGYEAYRAKVDEKADRVKDAIYVKPPVDALRDLDEFRGHTFH